MHWNLLIICLAVFFVEDGLSSLTPDTLSKCGLADNECQRDLIQRVLAAIGDTGVKELGIPPVDPLQLNNVSVSIFSLLELTLVEGVVKGVKSCVVGNVINDFQNGRFSLNLTCDITIKGHYRAYSASPLVETLLGGDFIRGDGMGKVKVEKIKVKIDFMPFVFKKNGEVFITTDINDTKFDFEILGDFNVYGNNIFLGDDDVSQVVTELLNQNAKSLAPYFAKPFTDKTLEVIHSIGDKFFEFVPARYYIKDDLTPFLKNHENF